MSLYLCYYILLHINLILMVNFSNFLFNIYPIFLIKSIIIKKNISINKKQIEIILEFAYTKYKIQKAIFKLVILD